MTASKLVVTAFAAGVLAAAGVAFLANVGVAEAHLTSTELSDAGEIVSMTFLPHLDPGDGGDVVLADLCGRTKYDDGGYTETKCYRAPPITGGAVYNGVNNLAAGQALTIWLQKRGLQ